MDKTGIYLHMKFSSSSTRKFNLVILLTVLFFKAGIVWGQTTLQIINGKENSLKTAETTSDSINILLDIYNLSDKVNRGKIRTRLINLAQRSNNNEVVKEMLRELSLTTEDGAALSQLIDLSNNLPEGSNLETIQTVLQMEKSQVDAPAAVDSQVENQMLEYIRTGMGLTGDRYKEIQNIYRAMMYLGTFSQGPLYYEYIQRLEELVDGLPEKDHAIRNLFYTTASIFYTRKRDYKKALDYDRKLIKELDYLKAHREKIGREIPDYDYFYYLSYRRMLRNFMGLSPQELEDIYQQCLNLAKEDEKVGEAFNKERLAQAYYYVGSKQFAKAVPELKKALDSDSITKFRRQELLGLLAWSNRETGNSREELEALRDYTQLMLEEREERRADTYKEIALRNSVNKLIADEYRERQEQHQENSSMRKISITLVYVLALILIFLAPAYLRLRRKVKDLEIRNNRLHKNIEDIFDDGVPKGSSDLRHQKSRLKG